MTTGFVVGPSSRRVKAGLLLCRVTVAATLLAAALPANVTKGGVELFAAEESTNYPDATAPGAIQYACSNESADLNAFFSDRNLPVNPALVRPLFGHRACHVFFEPTIAGFRASPDNDEIQGLFAVPDPLAFLVNPKPVGQSYDVIRSVLSRIERPLDVTLGLSLDFGSDLWPEPEDSPFRESRHDVGYAALPTGQDSPWSQDYFKAGKVDGRLRVLVPRHLFEGDQENGAFYETLLDSLNGEPYVRSKLSWEGGDLQFVLSPRDPSRLVLFYGESTLDYWGEGLDKRDLAYVLRLEFGADQVIDLSAIGPHTDYLVAFLPETKTALVSQPVSGNAQVALAAVKELELLYGGQAPKELQELRKFLGAAFNGLVENPDYVMDRVKSMRTYVEKTEIARNDQLQDELDKYALEYCPDNFADCMSLEGQMKMLTIAPDFLRRLVEEGNETHIRKIAPLKLLDLIAVQIPGELDRVITQMDSKAVEIQKLGFRVIRVPYLYTGNVLDQWAGISHVNLLNYERKLFVPTFGLGEVEERLLVSLQKKLKQDYEVVPVYARFSLLLNGGVHCLFGITRGTERAPLPRFTQMRKKSAPASAAPPAPPLTPRTTPAA